MTAPCLPSISTMASLGAALVVVLCIEVSHAAYCDLTSGGSTYCSRGCCGVYTITCCGSSSYISTTTYFSTGVIIAFVVGSIVGSCVLIGITIRCVRACSSRTTGTVIQQPQNQPHVIVMSTAQQDNYSGQQPYTGQPQPYPGPAPYPAQVGYTNPAYPPAQQGNTSTTYPPPFAGNPPPYGFNTETSPKANPGDNPPLAPSVSK